VPQPHGDLQLAIGYWIVSHKDQLRTWWAVSLLAIIGGSFLWAIAFFSIFFIQQTTLDRSLANTGAALTDYSRSTANAPRGLEVGEVTIIRRDASHVDAVALIKNPNTIWGVESMTISWRVPGLTLAPETVFVNPGASRPVMALNLALDQASAAGTTVGIGDIVWARASAAPLPDPVFATSGLALSTRSIQTPDGETFTTVNVRGNMVNQSVYNFFRVIVPIIVRAGPTIVAVDQVTQTNWPTLSAKSIDLTWDYPVSGATAIEVLPQASRFDADNLYR